MRSRQPFVYRFSEDWLITISVQQDCGANVPICVPQNDPECLCGLANRGNTSACQTLVCNDADYLSASALDMLRR